MTWNILTWDEDQPSWPRQGLFDVATMTAFCMIPLVISCLLGAPIWAVLTADRRRGMGSAAAIGFATTFLPVYGFVFSGDRAWLSPIPLAVAGGLIGAICWCAGWAAGYAKG